MTASRRLSYVKSEQVNAGGMNLQGLPLAIEGNDQPIGELDGLVIDLAERRVRYLVVKDATRGKHLLPLDATTLDKNGHTLERVSSDERAWEPFDPEAFRSYDEDAMMSLLFGQNFAA